MLESVIEGQGVYFAYGRHVVFDDFDIHVPRGSIYGLVGPNGCGKSTLLRLVSGLTRPLEGALSVAGESTHPEGYGSVRPRVGYLPQDNDLDAELTVAETVDLFDAFCQPRFNRALADKLIERFGLDKRAQSLVGQLSRGLKQRLALATAVAAEPEILLLDEPAAGLDAVVRRDFIETIIDYVAGGEGRTVVISSHLLAEIEPLIDSVGFLAPERFGSRLLIEASLGELKERILLAEVPSEEGALMDHEALLAMDNHLTMVFWCDEDADASALRQEIETAGGRVLAAADLDEIFVRLFRDAIPLPGRRVVAGRLHHV